MPDVKQGYQTPQHSEIDKSVRCNCNEEKQQPPAVPYRRINCIQEGGPAIHVANVAQCIYCGQIFGSPEITADGKYLNVGGFSLSLLLKNRHMSDFYLDELQSGKLNYIAVSQNVLDEIENRRLAAAL